MSYSTARLLSDSLTFGKVYLLSKPHPPHLSRCTNSECMRKPQTTRTQLCSGSEAGPYLRLIDFVYHSTLGVRVIKKKKKTQL